MTDLGLAPDLHPGALLSEMRARAPLVQCITNFVAMNVAANVLLAAGASPAMVHDARESGEFARVAAALTINIGTLSPDWLEGMRAAARSASAAGRPWVLDPVAHFATDFRRSATAGLMTLRPTIVRGNASEILALGGAAGQGRGADSGDPVEAAEAVAIPLARETGAVIAVTGPVDFVTDGTRSARVHGGSALMPRVTALGCALTCLTGAFAAARPDAPFEATLAALAMFGAAGEIAAVRSEGPGGFGWRFLDALAAVTPAELDAAGRVVSA
jgi:hydroxyethylthiazole kinase